jgi:cytochrome c556
MRHLSVLLTAVSLVGLAGCARQEEAAPVAAAPVVPATVAAVKQVMLGITIPASDIVFAAAGEAPADDTAWIKVQANAAVLAESARMLLDSSRKLDDNEWATFSRAMYDASLTVMQAAAEKNVDQLSEAGDSLYEACDGCHQKYMPARQGEVQSPGVQ